VAKPDGLVAVAPGREDEFLENLPVELMWGVGAVTQARLASIGIRTIGELAAAPDGVLAHLLGRAVGGKLASLAVNIDERRIESGRRSASMGAQAALGHRGATPELLRTTLGYLSDRVAGRLRAAQRAGRTVTVRVRFTGLRSVTRSVTLPAAISSTLSLTELATELARIALADHPGESEITLLAVSVGNLVSEPGLQLELPLDVDQEGHRPGTAREAARWGVDRSVDAIRARFGSGAVGYATVVFSDVDRVPEEFRELAERHSHDAAGHGPDGAGR
jgi:DNA polymerase-4